jgi:hypothetical protein
MARDASEVLGSPQLAGVTVNPRGLAKSRSLGMSGIYAGLIGAVVSSFASMKAGQKQAKIAAESQTPEFKRIALLAVTADELALVSLVKIKGKSGLEPQDVIVRVPRGEVASAELGGGGIYSPPLTITFRNGDIWQLETPRPFKKKAQEVVQLFGG